MSTITSQTCTVLGDGAFGTAFATLLVENGHTTRLWCFNDEVACSIKTTLENKRFLPGIKLSPLIEPITDMALACSAPWMFIAIPVIHLRSILKQCAPFVRPDQTWVCLSKGIEQETMCLPTDIMAQELGKPRSVFLAGPSYARDVTFKQPTVVSVSAFNEEDAKNTADLVTNNFFACALSNDIIGIQYAAAMKNSCALGTGILSGAGYGYNTQVRFALQYLEEVRILVLTSGGTWDALYAPAGIGDLILTCFGTQSRNYRLGVAIGKGEATYPLIAPNMPTVEGVNTLTTLDKIQKVRNIDLPLTRSLLAIVEGKAAPQLLVDTLCSRVYLSQ